MSISGIPSNPNKIQSFHWRNDSGELDVFEAARYFSGVGDYPGYGDSPGENRQRAARMSLDMPTMRNIPINSENIPAKKCKQPSSPGGRLASFLNSLISQIDSKKKKSKSKILEESSRKRSSSISHFSSNEEPKSVYSSTSSSAAITPTKSSYDRRCLYDLRRNGVVYADEFRLMRNSAAVNWSEDEEGGFRKFSDDLDDGADSDSSSDLFDLPNYDLGLPVYGTTNVGRIRIGAPISSN